MSEYVDFDKPAAAALWNVTKIVFSDFTPLKVLRDGFAVVGRVDIDALYEVTDQCAVQFLVVGCELQLDIENEQLNLQGGLNISPELRAVLTIRLTRLLSEEIAKAIDDCANWVEATEGAPDGFIGETYPPEDADETDEEQTSTAVVEGSTDNPY
jgi:hypothetical protein